jgi:hypothetical protein
MVDKAFQIVKILDCVWIVKLCILYFSVGIYKEFTHKWG